MKKEYKKPEFFIKAYAQFENVFTYCDKGNAHERGCKPLDGWPPDMMPLAAYDNTKSS